MKSLILALATAMTSIAGLAQTNPSPVKEDFKPSALNQPGQEYPQVNSQGYARFKIIAPYADSVSISLGLGGRGGTKLKQMPDSSWMGTTEGPLDEGFHYYNIKIDGGKFNDPGALNYYGSVRWESGIEIPAHDREFYSLKNVPHGKVVQVLFLLPAPILPAGLLYIRLRSMMANQKRIILYCTFNMDGVKTKLPGVTRVAQT